MNCTVLRTRGIGLGFFSVDLRQPLPKKVSTSHRFLSDFLVFAFRKVRKQSCLGGTVAIRRFPFRDFGVRFLTNPLLCRMATLRPFAANIVNRHVVVRRIVSIFCLRLARSNLLVIFPAATGRLPLSKRPIVNRSA